MAKTQPRKPVPRRPAKRKPKLGLDRGIVSVVMSIVSLTVLGAALITESILLLVVSALSALATAAHVRWRQQRAREDLRKAAIRRPSRPRSTTKPPAPSEPKPSTEPPAAGGVVLCTETGRKVDECGCASRHVASPEGARRYGLPVGSPMGKRAKKEKPAATVQRG